MMQSFRRFLGIDNPIDTETNQRAENSDLALDKARKEYHKTIQRVTKGVRLMDSWAEANRIINGGSRGKHSQ